MRKIQCLGRIFGPCSQVLQPVLGQDGAESLQIISPLKALSGKVKGMNHYNGYTMDVKTLIIFKLLFAYCCGVRGNGSFMGNHTTDGVPPYLLMSQQLLYHNQKLLKVKCQSTAKSFYLVSH